MTSTHDAASHAADIAGAHLDARLDSTFACYVVDADRRVLLTRVADDDAAVPSDPDRWATPLLGAVLPGERLSEAARRLAGDQLGLAVGAVRLVAPSARLDLGLADADSTAAPVPGAGSVDEACPVVVAVVDAGRLEDVLTGSDAYAAEPWAALAHAGQACRRDLAPWCAEHVALLDALGHDPLHWPIADPADLPSAHRESESPHSLAW